MKIQLFQKLLCLTGFFSHSDSMVIPGKCAALVKKSFLNHVMMQLVLQVAP